jgi:hypothetical protein
MGVSNRSCSWMVIHYLAVPVLNLIFRHLYLAAFEYLFPKANESKINEKEFNDYCGVNVTVTPAQIQSAVKAVFEKHKEKIVEQRYRYNTGLLIGNVRELLKWADGKAVRNEIEVQVNALLTFSSECSSNRNASTFSSCSICLALRPKTT